MDLLPRLFSGPPGAAARSRARLRRLGPPAAALVVAALGGAGYLLSGGPRAARAAPAQRVPALTVTAVAPRRAAWPVKLTASGAIAPCDEASIGTAAGGLRLVEVRVDVGDRVRRGQVLARLDPELLRAEEAQLQASDELAQADRQRALALQGSGAISDQEVLQLVTAAKVSAAVLAFKRLQLRHTAVVAPDDGVISARTATLGAVPPAGQELFRLIRGGRLEWRGELTAAQLSSVAAGQRVELALPDGGRASATVRDVAPTLDGRSRLGIVRAQLAPGSGARAGMYASGEVVVGQTPALVLPAESVVIRDGRSYVVKLADGSATPRVTLEPVTTGRRQGEEIEIAGGLAGSEALVGAGAGFLEDGDVVRVAEARTAPGAPVDGGPPR